MISIIDALYDLEERKRARHVCVRKKRGEGYFIIILERASEQSKYYINQFIRVH